MPIYQNNQRITTQRVILRGALENAGTGKCRYWKVPVFENSSTAVFPVRKIFIVQIVVPGGRLMLI